MKGINSDKVVKKNLWIVNIKTEKINKSITIERVGWNICLVVRKENAKYFEIRKGCYIQGYENEQTKKSCDPNAVVR